MKPKFRAKSLASGEFVYGGFCIVHDGLGSGIPCIWEVGADKGIPVDDSTLGQCLGLKDKYGEEIYEGDILTDEGDFGNDCWEYGVVIFDYDEYAYYIDWTGENVSESLLNCSEYSIAGNIYKNKDLLE